MGSLETVLSTLAICGKKNPRIRFGKTHEKHHEAMDFIGFLSDAHGVHHFLVPKKHGCGGVGNPCFPNRGIAWCAWLEKGILPRTDWHGRWLGGWKLVC
jgi:hypothetical protein